MKTYNLSNCLTKEKLIAKGFFKQEDFNDASF